MVAGHYAELAAVARSPVHKSFRFHSKERAAQEECIYVIITDWQYTMSALVLAREKSPKHVIRRCLGGFVAFPYQSPSKNALAGAASIPVILSGASTSV